MSRKVRTVRTVLQVLIAVLAAVPAFVAGLPDAELGAQIVAVAAVVTHYFHLVEALPFFPDALKVDVAADKPLP